MLFWRDSHGHEIDLILDETPHPIALEVKSSQTIGGDAFTGLRYWRKLTANPQSACGLIHGGNLRAQRHGIEVLPWWACP